MAQGPKFCAHPKFWSACWRRAAAKVAEPADKPGSVVGNHSSRRSVTATLKQPTRRHRGPRHSLPIWSCSRWGLPCRSVARLAVRSYRTVSPLPRTSCDAVRRSTLCCTFRRLAPPRGYLAPCPVEPGLSSAPLRMTRLPGRLRHGHCRTTALELEHLVAPPAVQQDLVERMVERPGPRLSRGQKIGAGWKNVGNHQ